MSENENGLSRETDELKAEILAELKTHDVIKRQVLDELTERRRKNKILLIIGHPVFLLFLGFLLTGGVGTWIASYWQKQQWDYQQIRLAQITQAQQRAKEKNDFRGEIVKEVENVLDSDRKLLRIYFSRDPTIANQLPDRLKTWHQTSDHWTTTAPTISVTLASDFENRTALADFEEIGHNLTTIRIELANKQDSFMINQPRRSHNESENYRHLDDIVQTINKTEERLRDLQQIMAREIQADEDKAFGTK
ncbi:MAG: hypothetical protein QOG23_142 [Blastocatellia bacterium]|nr:hypothetical protein [Blastocatellia bacterium]